MWEQDIGVFPADFAKQGDEWSYHLRGGLTVDMPMAGRGTDETAPVELGPPASGPVHSKLLAAASCGVLHTELILGNGTR